MRRRDIVLVIVVPFLSNLVLYLLTLAPTVTLEDSGELIAAAYSLGVAHPPGYPIFCIVGKLFTLLPLGSVAWRVNLMSAVFTALGTGVAAWVTLLLVESLERGRAGSDRSAADRSATATAGAAEAARAKAGHAKALPAYALTAAIGSGLMLGSSLEVWQQALIAEVYGLGVFVSAVALLLLVLWERADPARRDRYFYGLCFSLALGFLTHPISVILVPLAAFYIVLTDRRYLLSARRLVAGALWFALGISPVIYLPLASARDPLVDWGNPETFANFKQVVTRGLIPYASHGLAKTGGQIAYYFQLVARQWFPLLLVPVVLGFAVLLKRARRIFWFVLGFLVLAGPVVTVITNIDVTAASPEVTAGNKWIVSVFYIHSYICLSLAAGVGLWFLTAALSKLVKRWTGPAAVPALVAVLLPAVFIPVNYGRVDMSDYRFADDYVHNAFTLADQGALIVASFDPEYFPFVYYQAVERQRPDIAVIDPLLLQRSWAVQVLKDRQPDLVAASAKEVDEFLKAVAPFEAGRAYDGLYIQTKFDAMLNSFIDRTIARGRSVYFTSYPTGAVAAAYEKEPLGVLLRLARPGAGLTPVRLEDLRSARFGSALAASDFPASHIRRIYGSLFHARGRQLDAAGDKTEARRWYEQAAAFNRP
jgi:hypothetical protein